MRHGEAASKSNIHVIKLFRSKGPCLKRYERLICLYGCLYGCTYGMICYRMICYGMICCGMVLHSILLFSTFYCILLYWCMHVCMYERMHVWMHVCMYGWMPKAPKCNIASRLSSRLLSGYQTRLLILQRKQGNSRIATNVPLLYPWTTH